MDAAGTKPPCPDPDCPAPHMVRNGTLKGRQRYHCRGCGAWFGETHNTPMYRLRTPPEEVGRALLVVMRRGSLRAAEEITGHTSTKRSAAGLGSPPSTPRRSPKYRSTTWSSPRRRCGRVLVVRPKKERHLKPGDPPGWGERWGLVISG